MIWTWFISTGDGRHLLVCSSNGGVIYEMDDSDMTGSGYGESSSNNATSGSGSNNQNLVKVLGLKGHKKHATCTDWSASNDCGPCVTAGFDGQIRISTLLSQWYEKKRLKIYLQWNSTLLKI